MIDLVAYRPQLHAKLFAFLARCLPESGRSFDPEGRHAHLRDMETSYEAFWCLVESDEVVGCVGIRPLNGDTCELKTLFVYERLQGRGLGRRLAEHAIGEACTRGYRALRLDTISTSERAIALYRRLGFRAISRYNDNPKADVFMELILTPAPLSVD